jgi:hypothetical protein
MGEVGVTELPQMRALVIGATVAMSKPCFFNDF